MKKDKAAFQFQIQQLRMDKIVYAVDALLVCFAAFLLLVSLPMFYAFVPNLPQYTPMVVVGLAILAALYALIGNALRLKKIRKLEEELKA